MENARWNFSDTRTCRADSCGTVRAWRFFHAWRRHAPDLPLEIDPTCGYMINPGSVGQPRDGDPRAAYAMYDSDSGIVVYRRTGYDLAGAKEKSARPVCRTSWRTASRPGDKRRRPPGLRSRFTNALRERSCRSSRFAGGVDPCQRSLSV